MKKSNEFVKERDLGIDLLRIIACCFVIIIHISSRYINITVNEYQFKIGNLFNSFSRTAVPIFIMISGAFNLNSEDVDIMQFYKNKIKSIVIPTIIWSFLYVAFFIIIELLRGLRGQEYNVLKPIINWLMGTPAIHLWYMYMVIGLLIVTPFLINLRKYKGEKSLFIVGMVSMGIGALFYKYDLFWIFLFVKYIGYYILGYLLKKHIRSKNLNFLFGWVIGSGVIYEMVIYFKYTENFMYAYNNLSLPVILSTICLFRSFLNLDKISLKVSVISKHTTNIYFVHLFIIIISNILMGEIWLSFNPLIYIPLYCIFVFVISLCISKVIFCLKKNRKLFKLLL